MTWLCHRTCVHCYEERFRPYYGAGLDAVVKQSVENFARVVAAFPARMTYLDRDDGMRSKRGRIILAGGEILLEPVRESVLYPGLSMLRKKYESNGGVKLVVQTTGDLVTPRIIRELLDLGVWMISVSGIDAWHAGLESEQSRQALVRKLTSMFESAGLEPFDETASGGAHVYHFFGANPGTWIGSLWPRGRAAANEISTATISDNFCNRWSGGLRFLDAGFNGSEVSVDPEGNVFPCCIKTRKPVGNLLNEALEPMLARLRGNPVYEAISEGHPERMGIALGWTEEDFLRKSTITLPSGRSYSNLCVGCDAFHDQVLIPKLTQIAGL